MGIDDIIIWLVEIVLGGKFSVDIVQVNVNWEIDALQENKVFLTNYWKMIKEALKNIFDEKWEKFLNTEKICFFVTF